MPSLADNAFTLLAAFFNENGSALQGQHEIALRAFLQTLEKGLIGRLPDKYHLLSLDPGMGKTQACACFIKAWRDAGFAPASSILVGISSLDELRAFVASAGLDPKDFAVVTSDRDLNQLGAGLDAHDTVPVLFTTQQMLRSRTKGVRFADAAEFHHRGAPRVLRLWDEEILPSDGITIRLDALRAFASPLRAHYGAFVDAVDAFASAVTSAPVGSAVQMPWSLSVDYAQARAMAGDITDAAVRQAFWSLQLMAGSDMLLTSESTGLELIGSSPALPADFAPVVVMDASGRVRHTYDLWQHHRDDLVRLPSASNDYRRLLVRYWQRNVGKDALTRYAPVRDEIAAAIVEAVTTAPDEDWLIVTYKDSLPQLRQSVARALKPDTAARLHWLNWGRHLGTNQFRDVENIIIVGQRTYPRGTYRALGLAASDLPLSSCDTIDEATLRRGEHHHHLLQALCRASVRKASNGLAGRCRAFVISSLGDMEETLQAVFPGLTAVQWKDSTLPTGKLAQAIAYLENHFRDPDVTEIRKKDLREAIGIQSSPNLGREVLERDAFMHFLASHGLEVTTRSIRRLDCAFDPIDDGYIHDQSGS